MELQKTRKTDMFDMAINLVTLLALVILACSIYLINKRLNESDKNLNMLSDSFAEFVTSSKALVNGVEKYNRDVVIYNTQIDIDKKKIVKTLPE